MINHVVWTMINHVVWLPFAARFFLCQDRPPARLFAQGDVDWQIWEIHAL